MKKALLVLVGAAMLGGCAYTQPAVVQNGGKVVLPKNTGFFGLGRAVYVCKVTDGGLTECADAESP
jgi:hypothetical protein